MSIVGNVNNDFMPSVLGGDLERVRLSWIIQVGHKCYHMYFTKRIQGEISHTHTQREDELMVGSQIKGPSAKVLVAGESWDGFSLSLWSRMVLLTYYMISVQWNCLGLEMRPSHLDRNCVIWRKVPDLFMLLQLIPVNEEAVLAPSCAQSLCSFLPYDAPPDYMTGESLGCLIRNQKNYDKFQLHGDTHKCSVYNSNFDSNSENNFLKKDYSHPGVG